MAGLKLDLADFEIQQLLDKYRTPEALIDYKSFCENVDQVFADGTTAKDALDKHHSKPVRGCLNGPGANGRRT